MTPYSGHTIKFVCQFVVACNLAALNAGDSTHFLFVPSLQSQSLTKHVWELSKVDKYAAEVGTMAKLHRLARTVCRTNLFRTRIFLVFVTTIYYQFCMQVASSCKFSLKITISLFVQNLKLINSKFKTKIYKVIIDLCVVPLRCTNLNNIILYLPFLHTSFSCLEVVFIFFLLRINLFMV